MNSISSGFKDRKFRTHIDKPKLNFNYPRVFWKHNMINIRLTDWESSIVDATTAVAGQLLLIDNGNSGRAFNITFISEEIREKILKHSFIGFNHRHFDKQLLININL